jgi:hypothetical protein
MSVASQSNAEDATMNDQLDLIDLGDVSEETKANQLFRQLDPNGGTSPLTNTSTMP